MHHEPGSTGRRRYARRATKARFTFKPPRHPGRLIAIAVGVLAVTVTALVWGSALARKSEAYRERESMHDWMLDEGIAEPSPVSVPDIRAVAITPEQNIGPILIAGKHEGILLPLHAPDRTLYFASTVAAEAGLLPAQGGSESPDGALDGTAMREGLSLSEEVDRIARRELRVILTFTVTFPDAPDAATATYRRGLELALLTEYAAAGAHDLLIFGLPCGTDAADREAVAFLTELRALLSTYPTPPAVGAVLPLSALATEENATDPAPPEATDTSEANGAAALYAGRLTPGRLGAACDFLVLDLREETADSLEVVLPHLSYAYVRHSLRLLLPADEAAVDTALGHGFERVFEMNAIFETET